VSQTSGQETSFYSDQRGVRVTNTRVIFGNKTYSLANVSSVSVFTLAASRIWWIIIGGVLGLFGIVGSLGQLSSSAQGGSLACSFFLVATGGCFLAFGILRKDSHFVRLTASGGETNAWTSPDLSYIRAIVNAVNEAIVSRG
jgi:hypothetical protein